VTENGERQKSVKRAQTAHWKRGRAIDAAAPWIIASIIIFALYAGRSVLLPIILAILLSFLLAPIVAGFRRLRVPRAPAVLLAIALALGAIGITSAILVSQAATLSKDAPAYAERITTKAAIVRVGIHDRFGAILQTSGGSGRQSTQNARRAGAKSMERPRDDTAIPVEIREPPASAMDEIRSYVVPALAPVETTLIVLIVAIFILFQKEDLRDRLIRLMGTADLHRTTVALDEGAKRLSRYFLSQFVVNVGFGAVIWGGLFFIGVPSPGLWGVLAGLLRFIPYVGVLVAGVGPLALAAAVDPGWLMVAYVALLFLIVEPLVGYVIEPLLYGHSTGLSPVSVVVAALFWTWIWGPLGLVLAMPLTLMLVVLGRHIPAFEIFDVVFGDRPALSPAQTFYQRMLAGHPEEAIEQAELHLETLTLVAYYDDVILGGLRLAVADVDRGVVARDALHAVCATTLEVLEALENYSGAPFQTVGLALAEKTEPSDAVACQDLNLSIVCVPGRGPVDVAVARMASQLLRRAGCEVLEQARTSGPEDHISTLATVHANVFCILGLFDERSFRRMRPIMTNLKAAVPEAIILAGMTRLEEQQSTKDMDDHLLMSMAALCQEVSSVR
jgi:predicted PurR-regulated permease PerM